MSYDPPCPRCGHALSDHNDAGTFIPGGRYSDGMLLVDNGEMFCYGRVPVPEGKRPKYAGWGNEDPCGCNYDGPGTEKFF